jgi:NAD-dependent SIR2 family protein deacetylase
MKPHAMFFDESYSEHYYRGTTIKLLAEGIDALIVVGTALQTSRAHGIVYRTLEKVSVPVIEVNSDPCIKVGFTF